ncbi:MAG TPA: ATP-dependent RNA helicase HrpA [Burkholderiales bacterium]|nr:ATP-dependent RNA helicase HrpA [Burkholderiales bacterium]
MKLDPVHRLANLPRPTYPDELPVVARKDEIARAIQENQVVIVSGETGSGKTTQLPKICLEIGRGVNGLIGHTQPRRIAARTVAARIAQELKSPLGHAVGYKVRFADKLSADTYVKLMTDGILLAETQGDRLLKAYDTIIIDEAHERSLNIDFLLGYLKRLLPRRPDLKVIVTSATIETERFSKHFAHLGKPAPVIEVSGRMYPVEHRYRPLEADNEDEEEQDMEDAIVAAVDELARERSGGDILVFLPGEREIRETAEELRKHHPKGFEILPLYARLSFEEQERVFRSGGQRRIVLATNVAETSLTVPGIRYVIDTGLARVNRYSWRNKVEQLQVEKISRASANQRAGRCGRLGPGVCVRLYSQDDYDARPEFTDPEILRSSLAAVILRMKSLRIGDVEDFPFIEPPGARMIADGYQLLAELGAVDEQNQLTQVGWQLAKFPIDPRIARMVLAAKRENCLREVLIIASALSIQDPRERPFDKADAADRAQERFDDERSDFLAYLKLWDFFEESLKHKKSNRKLIDLMHEHFLSHRRMREWRDIHGQLAALVGELGMHPNTTEATYEQVHRALLAGLLGNIGLKSDDGAEYIGARDIKFLIFPGSVLKKATPKWIMAAEIVETTRLYARNVARIVPDWIEPLAVHLVKRHYSDPHWDKERGMVMAYERVTLHGLTIVPRRRIHYGPINPLEAREIFIHKALAAFEFETRGPFLEHNRKLVRELKELENKARRRDVLVDEHTIYEFYDAIIPEGIYNRSGFERWRRDAEAENPQLLFLTREYLMQHAATEIAEELFPDKLATDGADLKLRYRFEPGHPLDGVTVTVPLHLLNTVGETPFDWLVPGMLREKVTWAMKALPKGVRKHLFPLPEQVTAFLQWADAQRVAQAPSPAGGSSFSDSLRRFVQRRIGEPIPEKAWDEREMPQHLKMNFRVVDESGRELAVGRDLLTLKGQLGQAAQLTFGEQADTGIERADIRTWDFGDLPEEIAFTRKGRRLTGYPALVDEGGNVAIRLFDLESAAEEAMRGGVRRLLRIALKEQMKQLEKGSVGFLQSALQLRSVAAADDLREDLINAIADRAFLADDPMPRSQKAFEAQRGRARTRLPAVTEAATRLFAQIAEEYQRVNARLAGAKGPLSRPAADVRAQLSRLVYKGFFSATPWEQLSQLPRYLKAMELRLDKYGNNPERDAKHTQSIADLTKRLDDRIESQRKAGVADPRLDEFRWALEELRVSLFAQELRTPYPVSYKRLEKMWSTLRVAA